MKFNPPNDLPETFKGIERQASKDHSYSYCIHSFAWIIAKYHGDAVIGDAPSYEISLIYEGHKPLTIFCYSKVEIDDAFRRCWDDLGFQIRVKLIALRDRLETYENIDAGHDERSFWQRLD